MKNEFNKNDGTMRVTSNNTRVSKKVEIIIKDTDIKCCANCKGFGHECNNGAWVYCEIRHYHDNRFDGDCGELKGCQFFNKEKIKEHEYEWLSKAFALNSSLYTNSCDNRKTAIELKTYLDDLKDLMSDIDSLIDDIE